MNMEDLYRMFIWPIQTEKVHAYDNLQRALVDFEGVFGGLKLADTVKEKLKEEIKKKFQQQPVKIRAIFELRSFTKNGVEDLRRILKLGESMS